MHSADFTCVPPLCVQSDKVSSSCSKFFSALMGGLLSQSQVGAWLAELARVTSRFE
jgi:hypothetical protein